MLIAARRRFAICQCRCRKRPRENGRVQRVKCVVEYFLLTATGGARSHEMSFIMSLGGHVESLKTPENVYPAGHLVVSYVK